ncbi:aminoglycoside phosphotransferase [Lentithecium fluviatile CBS 122367]|uniref:Aminoglycoside phosphotransferase n=1 Tax=Lentithecium fluviatile CBS 122367 TaxID=1168545 RepID=A0A6G1JCP9_9PLEO|nr:aminoglycoside phosphotransferase [Lentithecium fluviatile CBS 122367]
MTAAADATVGAAAAAVNVPSLAKLAIHPGDIPPPPELPVLPEDVTTEWLSKVLESKVKSVVLGRTISGTATKVFVTVTYEDDSSPNNPPTQLCIKGGFDPNFIQMMPWIVMIYQRECDFYNHVALKLDNMELPRSWWAGHNATQGIVAMDDLAAQGCDFGNPAEAWTVSRVLAGVEQLAALHAKTWHLQASDYPWLTSDYDQAILTLMNTYDAVVKGPDRPKIPEYLKDQERVTAVLKKHYALRNPRFRCLLHGDSHTGNTYLVNGAPRFLDWQMIHIGSAFHDLSYFIGAALTVEDRRAREWDIVNHYLRTLEKFGVDPLFTSDEELANEYKKSFLAGVGWIMCPYEMQAKECVHPMALRYAAALDDHKVLELVEGLPDLQ